MGMTEKNILEDKYIERLEKIFEEKKWEIGEKETSYFDIFCKRLAKLKSDKDREFILELTEDYLLVTLEKYEEFLILAIEKFFKEESKTLETVDTIHVCPLIKKDDSDKIKSSKVMLYLLQGIFLKNTFLKYFDKKQLLLYNKIEDLENNEDKIKYLILIDDYIGSGETALTCIGTLKQNKNINIESYSIITLVIQKKALNFITSQEKDIKIYFATEREQGITDKYPPNEIKNKIEQMKNISKMFISNEKMYLGYNDSEGLVSMIRTPNNTFPFYWYEKKKGHAPFSREGTTKFNNKKVKKE